MLPISETSARYDKLATLYDILWRRYNNATCAEVLRHLRRDWHGARVLDVGAGTGFFLGKLRRQHPEIAVMTALDSSAQMLEMARRKFENDDVSSTRFARENLWKRHKLRAKTLSRTRGISRTDAFSQTRNLTRKSAHVAEFSRTQMNFVRGNAENLPFENASFDVVVSMNALHYLAAPQHFFAEAHRVLDVGGTLLVQDYTRNGWPFFAAAMRVCDGGTRRLYSPRELNDLAENAGFVVERARNFGINWFWRGVLLRARKA